MVTIIAGFGLKLAVLWMCFCATRLVLHYCLLWMPKMVVFEWIEEERIQQILDELQVYHKDLMSWYANDQAFLESAWVEKIKDIERRYSKELVDRAKSRFNAMEGEKSDTNLVLFRGDCHV